ncbi:alpha/beta fold hydrolase [Nocardioides sp. KIGAM211]|uniref:Alpha/beta fold hydrolase n=1 Tax=Nocardioides luti TaxID=2761101 RepID=A0A7X0RF16_9ACTN|nr:alpha/beta fold hydrolase [Nocardioides luti]
MKTTLGIAAVVATATLSAVPVTTAQAAAPTTRVTNACLTSVPDPGTTEKVQICYSLFRPAGATKRHRVPLIMHSHGWGGSRTTDPAGFQKFLDAGYAVLSFDQRGFGESGGQAYVENPTVEGHDVRRLVRLVSRLPWVQQDGKGDPHLGAIGGSYGGGYQFLGAFEELRVKGKPVFDALAPEITWFDLHESLAPRDVVRTAWASVLTAAAQPSNALPPKILTAFTEGAATGTWPDGSSPTGTNLNPFFRKNGPKWHVDHGRRLDIPVLFGQGTTDSLFPLEQGLQNWKKSITKHARKHSIFVAYNGGHVLPAVTPPGVNVSSDPCSKTLAGGSFEDLSLRFFDEQLKHRHTGLKGYGRYHLATPDSTCTTVGSVRPDKAFDIGTVATTETGGAPLSYAVAQGPIRIAGSSYVTASMTALGATNRAFYGLAVGTTPADAHLVQNNVLPINEAAPVTGEKRRFPLPSVAIDVPEGQTLYLLASPVSDTFVGMGSRTPGAVVLEDTVVHLPVVRR